MAEVTGTSEPRLPLKAKAKRSCGLFTGSICKFVTAGIVSLFAAAAHAATVPLFPSQTHPSGQGFVRVINHSNSGGEVFIRATDDSGATVGPVTLSIGANKTVHFNSEDLEVGNTGKGLSDGIGSGQGN